MFFLREPQAEQIQAFLDERRTDTLTYDVVGATRQGSLPGYLLDHNRILLGHGQNCFASARLALQRWQHFEIDWLRLCWPSIPIEPGAVVAVLARALGVWSLTPCRIVYVLDEAHRSGFAWGSLPSHVATGEERFLVEWDPVTDEVHYDVLALSLPRHWLAHLGFYYVRKKQRDFARDTKQAMLRATQPETAH